MDHLEIQTNRTIGKVIELIHENYIDWMHACGKKGRCTSCKMIVDEGMENLSPLSAREKYYAEKGRLKPAERLTCQTILKTGSIKIRVAEENKFSHIDYSE
ncbi:2Fe-2S iron-sulfur cluster binding domain-containing protein [Anditalea andensis]|nr:2Fe-2S iron-sulfur cluster-binding protein [Anditalea andensis]